jgi:hypothetical protein
VGSERAERALWVTLASLAALRALLAILPAMHGWGLNFPRFMSPAIAWLLWALGAAALVPALARRGAAGLGAIGARLRGVPGAAYAIAALVAGALAALLPDAIGFVGDFLLRVGILQEPEGFTRMFPQALPLDRFLHYLVPRGLGSLLHADPNLIARALGIAEAMALGLLAVRFARLLGLEGPAASATAGVVLFGGYLALYTGYGKPTIEIGLLTVALGVWGLEMVGRGRGMLAAGLAVAAALALHRAALSMLPGFAAAWLIALAAHGRSGAWRRPRVLASLGIPLLLIAPIVPRLVHLFFGFDVAVNFRSVEVRQQGGMLRAALSPLKLMDIANVILLLSPLAATIPALALAHAGSRRRREALYLGVLALGFAPSLFFVYVTQGPFRDWDAFAGAGASLSLLAAWLIGETLRNARRPWLGASVALAVAVPTLQVMLSQHDLERSLARARAFVSEPPRRTESQRIATWDFIGLRSLRLGRWADAAAAYEEVARAAPHPRALELWGTAAVIGHDWTGGERAFRTLIAREPEDPIGWLGLWITAGRLGDSTEARAAARKLRGYRDDGPELARIVGHLEHYPRMWESIPRGKEGSALRGPGP